jgi:hypothetical protein
MYRNISCMNNSYRNPRNANLIEKILGHTSYESRWIYDIYFVKSGVLPRDELAHVHMVSSYFILLFIHFSNLNMIDLRQD